MAAHNELGLTGEDLATAHLLAKGYAIRHRNWRWGHQELDIVAEKNRTLVIVEVKTRRSTLYGPPEEALTAEKIRHIVHTAETYVKRYATGLPVRFDLITVVVNDPNEPQLRHIENAFQAPLYGHFPPLPHYD